MKFQTVAECEEALAEFIVNSRFHDGLTTERTLQLALHVGNPESELKVVHVAGTSGKTSTCYFTAALLTTAGVKTGTTISPHVGSLAERVQINAEPLPDETFVRYFSEFHDIVVASDIKPAYFEFMMVFALWVFRREQVDYAVVETGLGGLHDSSNICTRHDKVCVLTDIALDHQIILGDSISEIAEQKAGIIWHKNHVLMYEQIDDAMVPVKARVLEMDATLELTPVAVRDNDSILPLFQQRNWQLALAAYEYVAKRDGLPILDDYLKYETQRTVVPARMETYDVDGTTVMIDGAHNEQKMRTFFESFEDKYGTENKPVIILALKNGKDLNAVAPLIAKHAKRVIATEFKHDQDMPFGAQPAEDIARALEAYSVPVSSNEDISTALQEFMTSGDSFALVIGSLHSAAEARAVLNK